VMGRVYVVVPVAPNRGWGVCMDGVSWGEVLGGCWSEGGGGKGVSMGAWYQVCRSRLTGPSKLIQNCGDMVCMHGGP
jgi:hypothetical protein